jgi:hypothetical protein
LNDRHIEAYFLGLLGLYTALGFYGVLWISDEFDEARAAFFTFFAVPWAFYFFIRALARPQWRANFPASYWCAVALLILSFAWGNSLWMNAISGQKRAVVNVTLEGDVYAMAQLRGGFHWLYKPRW